MHYSINKKYIYFFALPNDLYWIPIAGVGPARDRRNQAHLPSWNGHIHWLDRSDLPAWSVIFTSHFQLFGQNYFLSLHVSYLYFFSASWTVQMSFHLQLKRSYYFLNRSWASQIYFSF